MPLGINEVGRNVSKYELSFQITFCVPMCPSRWGQVKTESCAHIITSIDSLIIQSWHVTKLYLKITMIAWGRCRNNVKDQQGGWETLRHQALNRPRQAAPISIPPLLSHGSDGSCGTGASRSPWSASCSSPFQSSILQQPHLASTGDPSRQRKLPRIHRSDHLCCTAKLPASLCVSVRVEGSNHKISKER